MINYNRPSGQVTWTNGTGSAVAAGDVVVLGNRIGIAAVDIANGSSGVIDISGVFTLAAVNTVAFAVGDDLFWDATAAKLNKTEADNNYAGMCDAVKAETATTAKVEINAPSRKKVTS
jgi:predicted RecA/RadA family phage recombinase